MNHSRYSLPKRIGGRFVVILVAFACRIGAAAGQETGPALTAAGNAAPAAAQQPLAAPVAKSALPDPQQLLAGATRMIARQKSIVAKVRHRATIYDRELIGSGEYAQGPELARLLRYELRIQVDKRVVNLLQVADGRHLWISYLLKEEPDITRIDVDRVLAATDPAAVGQPLSDPNRQLGLGGLSQLMTAIEKDFEFNSVYRSQLGGLPVYGIEGRWKKEAYAAFTPKPNEALDKLKGKGKGKGETIRGHVPDRVRLFLGVDDLFPYRFEFRRSIPAAAKTPGENDGIVAGGEDSKPLLVLEFFEVQFDVPIEERQFQFSPGSRPFVDITEKFLAARKAVP